MDDRPWADRGRIDVWINNAAVLEPLDTLTDADVVAVEHHFRTNVLRVALGSRTYVRQARRQDGGVLINEPTER